MIKNRFARLCPGNKDWFLVESCHVRKRGLVVWWREENEDLWLCIVGYDVGFLFGNWYQRPWSFVFLRRGQCKVFRWWRALPFVRLSGVSIPIVTVCFIVLGGRHFRNWRGIRILAFVLSILGRCEAVQPMAIQLSNCKDCPENTIAERCLCICTLEKR